MKVFVKGGSEKNLTKNAFLASGGEGQVYVLNNVAYKIYNDPSKMIPVAKIQELQTLTSPNIIRPENVVLNAKNNPIGYTMKFVKNTNPLCKIFTKSFKSRNSLKREDIIELVKKFRETMKHVHDNGILVVDVNELNFLVNDKFNNIFFIDVDSYQTPHFPATAIMENIKDRHAKSFSELSDWFSWGIITFQMFVGIHPFKGKHPSINDMKERMQKNISVFNKRVSIPSVCEPLDSIPQAYRDWYKALFEEGKRMEPPFGMQNVIIIHPSVVAKVLSGGQYIVIDKMKEFTKNIISYSWIDGNTIVLTEDELYVNNINRHMVLKTSEFAVTTKKAYIIAANLENNKLKLKNVSLDNDIQVDISGDFLISYKGTIYVKQGSILNELKFIEMPNSTQAVISPVANVMDNSSLPFNGLVMQDMLEAWYASIFPKVGLHYQIHLKELAGYKIIDAKFDNGIIVVVGSKKGRYDKFIFRLSQKYDNYDFREIKDVDYIEMNFAVLETGVCASITEDGQLELSVNKMGVVDVKVVNDPIISEDMTICSNGSHAVVFKDNVLYKISLKKKVK